MEQNVNRRGFIGAAIGTGAAAAMTPPRVRARRRPRPRSRRPGGSVPQGPPRHPAVHDAREDDRPGQAPRRPAVPRAASATPRSRRPATTAGPPEQFQQRAAARGPARGLRPRRAGLPGPTGWETGYRETLAYAKELGQKFTGFAWFPSTPVPVHQRGARGTSSPKVLNTAGKIARDEYGLTFFYHNHDFEFLNRFGGRYAYDILQEETDRQYVKFELDLVLDHRGRRATASSTCRPHPDAVRRLPRQGPRVGRPAQGRRQ